MPVAAFRLMPLVALAAVLCVGPSASRGQDAQSPGESPATVAEAPSEVAEAPSADALLRQAYALSQKAEAEADFTAVIDLCTQGLEAKADAKQRQYGSQLMAWALNRRGESRAEAGDEEQALADFERAIELDATRWKAIHNRGVSRAMQGDYEGAMADFNRAIELNSRHAHAWFNRGELHSAQANWNAALNDYNQALQLDRNDAATLVSRGYAYYRRGQSDQALNDYNQAVRIDARNASARVQRGMVLAEMGRLAEASTDLQAAIELDGEMPEAYLAAAWLMATSSDQRYRDAERALQAANRAMELGGDTSYRFPDTLAAAHANAGQYAEAAAIQQRAIELAGSEAAQVQQELKKRLELYEQNQPYRESPRQARGVSFR